MNIETFNNLLDAHGADIQSWPDPEAAQEFLQRVPKVREELALALAIEQELATKATQAPATLAAQILSKLPDQPKPHTLLWRELLSLFPKDRAWIPAASALVPLLSGFVLGLNNASFAADDQEDYYLWIFADKLEQATFDTSPPSSVIAEDQTP